MMESDIKTLNEKYAIPGHISFHAGPGELIMAVINNIHAQAALTLAGGHVMSYQQHGHEPLLWISPNASYTIGKAMRGGVPVCWPWFANHPTHPQEMPLHGFVRTMLWEMVETRALADGSTVVRMVVRDTAETLALWPHQFELELSVTVGPHLRVAWTARNPGQQPYQYTGALHPYYPVSDIRKITIRGLEGTDYLDKTENYQRKTQAGPLKINGWTDAIFLDTTAALAIEDPGLGHTLQISKLGSRTTVVWNPDVKDAEMADVGEGQHCFFVCAEAANAVDDVVTVAPGGEGHLAMELWTE